MPAAMRKEGPAIGALHEVRASFRQPDAMQQAVDRLETSGFDRADLSLPEPVPSTPDAGARPVDGEADARQARTLHVSAAAAAAALAAAGGVIAGGGAVTWAALAAVVGAAVAGGIVYLLSSVANQGEQMDRERKAVMGTLILSVRTPSAQKRGEAVAILRAAGGTELEVQ